MNEALKKEIDTLVQLQQIEMEIIRLRQEVDKVEKEKKHWPPSWPRSSPPWMRTGRLGTGSARVHGSGTGDPGGERPDHQEQ